MQPSAEQGLTIKIFSQLIDLSAPERDIAVTDLARHRTAGTVGQLQHVGIAVESEHRTLSAHQLTANKGVLTAAAAQIEHTIARSNPAGGVTAAVITAHHLLRDDLQQRRIKGHRRAEASLLLQSSCAIALVDGIPVIGRAAGVRHWQNLIPSSTSNEESSDQSTAADWQCSQCLSTCRWW